MSSSSSGVKRARTDDPLASAVSTPQTIPPSSTSNVTASSAFRNVSACNRCRQRKNRCDQNLPSCSSCEKARVKCVGFDPITKREIPRTYVYYLESRVSYLETLLANNGIPYATSEDFDLGAKPSSEQSQSQSPSDLLGTSSPGTVGKNRAGWDAVGQSRETWNQVQDDERQLNRLVSNIGMVSVQGASDPRYLGSTSGISFARVVFASIKNSVSAGSSKRGVQGPSRAAAIANRSTVRDTFFGLQSKPTIEPATFPDQEVGARLVALYFEHANPQIPILHRGEFMALFHRAYTSANPAMSAREIYMLNIVFAIGAGIILEDSHSRRSSGATEPLARESGSPEPSGFVASSKQHQPEEYHAAAMSHLDSFLGSMSAVDESGGLGSGLEELQAVLLLAGFALLRPVAPGLWYISGVATRLAVDLGLHHEDGTDLDESWGGDQRGQGTAKTSPSEVVDVPLQAQERGRREWVRDLRRRLWWCVYSFDRLVSTCVGRPFGITDQVITTDFPSILNDEDITRSGFRTPSESVYGPSYKRVSHHYFRLRLLQSEILQVLQYRQAKEAHAKSGRHGNQYMHTKLSSSFLQPFRSFRAWRQDMDRRLWEWKEDAPQHQDTTVQFSVQFLELNYWQALIMLYRQSLSGLPNPVGQTSPLEDLANPMSMGATDVEDEDVYLKVAEAGQRVLMLYRQLHRIHLVNYTYLATVHLFMAGIAFLYVLWHSHTVRSRLTLDEVDFTVLAATSVLGDLMEKCPPAEACRDAFERMSRATIKMCLSTTGFGSKSTGFEAQAVQRGQDVYQAGSQRSSARHAAHIPGHPSNGIQGGQEAFNHDRFEQYLTTEEPAMSPQHQAYQPLADIGSSEDCFVRSHPMQPTPLTGIAGPDTNDPFYGTYDHLTSNGVDALLAGNEAAVFDTQFGTNLGFGEDHDWSDGVQLDMFDGFFFGGTNNGNYVS